MSPEDKELVSVVVRTYNEERMLASALGAVRRQKTEHPVEIVVVDSGSSDRTLEIAKAYSAKVVRIGRDEFTYGRSLNIGAAASKGRYLVFLSGHAVPADERWLDNLVRNFKNPAVAGVFGKQLPFPECNPLTARLMLDHWGDKPRLEENGHFFSASNAAVRADMWAEVQFNESLPASEDHDWAKRVQSKGRLIAYDPEAAVYHSHNESSLEVFRRNRREIEGNLCVYGGRIIGRYLTLPPYYLLRDTLFIVFNSYQGEWLLRSALDNLLLTTAIFFAYCSYLLGGQGGRRHGKRKPPKVVILEITRRCNLRCVMCNFRMNEKSPPQGERWDMSDKVFDNLEGVISTAEVICLGGGGENTIGRKFRERILRIRELNPNAWVYMFTNGLAFSNREFAEEIAPLFSEIQVSLNGVGAYEEIMRGGSLDKVLEGLRNISSVRRTGGMPKKLTLGYVLMRRNVKDIVDAARLAKEIDGWLRFKDMWVFREEMKSESLRHDPKLKRRVMAEIAKAVKLGANIEFDLCYDLDPRNVKPLAVNPLTGGWMCHYPWTETQIQHDGTVYLCCMGLTLIGNANDAPFEEIWNDVEAERYRMGVKERRYYKDCGKCKLVTGVAQSFEKL